MLACVEALRDERWGAAWVARYGAGVSGSARDEASWEFHNGVKVGLNARARPTGALRTRAHARAWLDWASAQLHPVIIANETATLRELAGGAMHGASSPPPSTVADAPALGVEDGSALLRSHTGSNARYRFDASTWHAGGGDGPCTVCAAGAILAARFDVPAGVAAEPRHFSPAWRAVLDAVDFARSMRWDSAFDAMHGTPGHPGAEDFARKVGEQVAHRHIPRVWQARDVYAR